MNNRFLFLQILVLASYGSFSHSVDFGATTPSASSAPDNTAMGEGLLKPRMSTTSIIAIAKPARGLWSPINYDLSSLQ